MRQYKVPGIMTAQLLLQKKSFNEISREEMAPHSLTKWLDRYCSHETGPVQQQVSDAAIQFVMEQEMGNISSWGARAENNVGLLTIPGTVQPLYL